MRDLLTESLVAEHATRAAEDVLPAGGDGKEWGVKEMLRGGAATLFYLMRREGELIAMQDITRGSRLCHQNAANALNRLQADGFVRRAVEGLGPRTRYVTTQRGRDVVAEIDGLLEACLGGALPEVPSASDVRYFLSTETLAALFILGGGDAARALERKDQAAVVASMATFVGVEKGTVRRLVVRLTERGVAQSYLVAPGANAHELTSAGLRSVRLLHTEVREARERRRPLGTVTEGGLRVLLETAAPVLKRGETTGKPESDFIAPHAKQHLADLVQMGLVECIALAGEPRWLPSSEGLRIAARLRDGGRGTRRPA